MRDGRRSQRGSTIQSNCHYDDGDGAISETRRKPEGFPRSDLRQGSGNKSYNSPEFWTRRRIRILEQVKTESHIYMRRLLDYTDTKTLNNLAVATVVDIVAKSLWKGASGIR